MVNFMRCYKVVLSQLAVMFLTLMLLPLPASAGVTIAGTRIIFPAGEKEKSVRTNNKGAAPVLVQVWIDDGSKSDDINKVLVPFTVTPPVYRIDPGKGQSVRLIYNGMELPKDRESVYWFNLLEIPTTSQEDKNKDRLELAFRTRVKVFYRPQSLTESSVDNADKLRWSVDNSTKSGSVVINNPTPYYFSFESIKVVSAGKTYPLAIDMIAPFSTASFGPENNKQALPSTITSIDFNMLNDYGSIISKKMVYQQGQGLVLSKSTEKQP